ncbi:hypothetical protein DNTS_024675, partial [Danionella cerebrum]
VESLESIFDGSSSVLKEDSPPSPSSPLSNPYPQSPVNLKLHFSTSVLKLMMTTFYSGHDYGCRRTDGYERKMGSQAKVNLRQNLTSTTSILKHPNVQQIQDGHLHPAAYTSCTLPLSVGKTRTRFLNLRDSVKKSPTKSTAKANPPPVVVNTESLDSAPYKSLFVLGHLYKGGDITVCS